MPKALHRKLARKAAAKGLTGKRLRTWQQEDRDLAAQNAQLRADLQRIRRLAAARLRTIADLDDRLEHIAKRFPECGCAVQSVEQAYAETNLNRALAAEADLQRMTEERDALAAHREHWEAIDKLNHEVSAEHGKGKKKR